MKSKFNPTSFRINHTKPIEDQSTDPTNCSSIIKPVNSMFLSDRHVFTPFPLIENIANAPSLIKLLLPHSPFHSSSRSSRVQANQNSKSLNFKHQSHHVSINENKQAQTLRTDFQTKNIIKSINSAMKTINQNKLQSITLRQNISQLKKNTKKNINFMEDKKEKNSYKKTSKRSIFQVKEENKDKEQFIQNNFQNRKQKFKYLTIKLECIPLNIFQKDYRQYIKNGMMKGQSNSQSKQNLKQIEPNNGEDQKKRLMIKTREQNLRQNLMREILYGGQGIMGPKKHFISYFPQTDYELALKQYLNRQQAQNQLGKFSSQKQIKVNDERQSSWMKLAKKRATRRQSCFVFTEFNRNKYQISMTREQLINCILQAKNSSQITDVLLDKIQQKIQILVQQKYNTELIQPQNRIDNQNVQLGQYQKQQLNRSQKISINCQPESMPLTFDKQNKQKISIISAIEPNQLDSQKNIFTQLIASIGIDKNYQSNQKTNSFSEQCCQSESVLIDKHIVLEQIHETKQHNTTTVKTKQFYATNVIKIFGSEPKKTQKKQLKTSNVNVLNKIKTNNFATKNKIYQSKRNMIEPNIIQKQKESKTTSIQKAVQSINNNSKTQTKKLKKIKINSINKIPVSTKLQLKLDNSIINRKDCKQLVGQQMKQINESDEINEASDLMEQQKMNEQLIHLSSTESLLICQDIDHLFEDKQIPPILTGTEQIYNLKISPQLLAQNLPINKLILALKILQNISESYVDQIIANCSLYIFGKWNVAKYIPVQPIKYNLSKVSLLCIFISQICKQRMELQPQNIQLQQILKLITGMRIICFKNKFTRERQVNYHLQKQHHLFAIHRQNSAINIIHKIIDCEGVKIYQICNRQKQITAVDNFEQLVTQYQIISISNRINRTDTQYWHAIDSQISYNQIQHFQLQANSSTKGTITLFFPEMQGNVVELSLEKIIKNSKNGETHTKLIGSVGEKLRYDNIYFQFSIHGIYRLTVKVQDIFVQNYTIAYQTNQKIKLELIQK